MKVKIRKTGEVVDIITYSSNTYRSDIDVVSYIDSKGNECVDMKMNRFWDFEDVGECNLSTKESLIDWEQRRYETAREIAANIVAHTMMGSDALAKLVVGYADAIIRELKENNPKKEVENE